MEHPASTLDAWLDEMGVDGHLIDADGADPAQRYLSGFDAPDPYLTLYTPQELVVLVSPLEAGRARRMSAATTVVVTTALGADDLRAVSYNHLTLARMGATGTSAVER